MTILLAVVCTAAVAGAAGWALARTRTVEQLARAIDGRTGVHPLDEHRRVLAREAARADEADRLVEQLKLSLEALTSGVIIADHRGRILVRNRLATDVASRSHEQTLIDATTAELVAEAIQGKPCERELEVFGPPSRTLYVHAVPIFADAEVVGALAVIDDVTDHHRIDKTRRDFVANLSHELRTPVGALSLLAEMLVDEQDPDTRAQLSQRVVAETGRLSHTIDDLLQLSRIESASDRFDDVIEVRELIDECIARTATAADAAGVTVGSVAPTDPIRMSGNRDQLVSALVNLIDNAVKYSSRDDSVSVRGRLEDDQVLLTVQDTGRGIPARDLDRIFERFYRVDRSRDSATGGTGIGLSIVRHVALNHGGTVTVDSFEGEGSTFVVALPYHPAAAPATDSTTEVA